MGKRKTYTIEELENLGFDKTKSTDIGYNIIGCSACDAWYVKGKPTHEEDCKNVRKGSYVRKVVVYEI